MTNDYWTRPDYQNLSNVSAFGHSKLKEMISLKVVINQSNSGRLKASLIRVLAVILAFNLHFVAHFVEATP